MSDSDVTSVAAESSEALPSRGVRWRRSAWRIGRVLLVVYVGLMIVLYALQTKMIFPGASTQGAADSVVRPRGDIDVVQLRTAQGQTVAAMFGRALQEGRPHPDAASRPTILFFYGNGMCMAYAEMEFDALRRRGFNVIVPDYVGYGMSSGSPSEQGCYDTAEAAYQYLVDRDDVDMNRVVAMGWSLGAAVAIELAHRHPVQAVVACSPFTSMNDMAHLTAPFLPTGLLLKHHFRSDQKLPDLTCPIFLAHGRHDEIIPMEMSYRLKDLARGRVTGPIIVEQAGHNDLFLVGGTDLIQQIAQFIEGVQ